MTSIEVEGKLARRFARLDADGDGLLRREDLLKLAVRVCVRLVPEYRSTERAAIIDGFETLWRQLAAHAEEADGLTLPQFVAGIEHVTAHPQRNALSLGKSLIAIFDAVDGDGSGWIDRYELATVLAALSWDRKQADTLFDLLDTDDIVGIDRDEFVAAVSGIWREDDESLVSALFDEII